MPRLKSIAFVLLVTITLFYCVWWSTGGSYLDFSSMAGKHTARTSTFPPELVQYAAERNSKTPLDEREDVGVRAEEARAANTAHPWMNPNTLRPCLRGKRILFLGHSHMGMIADQLAASLGVSFTSIDAWFGSKKGFLVRKMFDGYPFSLRSESLVSLNYRAALHAASPQVVDAHRFDVIYVTRSMWDLVYNDTHPKDFVGWYADALVELLTMFLKKDGGRLVVWPVHCLKPERDHRGCFSRKRATLIREASFLSIRRASELSGVPIVTPASSSTSSQNIVIWDPYEFTKTLPIQKMPDGQHVDSSTGLLYAEVLIRGLLRCEDVSTAPAMPNATVHLMKTSFLAEIPQPMKERIDWLEATPKSKIPWGRRKCRCGRTELGIDSVHPTCLLFSPKARHLMVQRYLKYPLVGPSELQMKELIHLICTASRARIVVDCFKNMGVTNGMSDDLTLPLVQPAVATSSGRCSCFNAATSVQGSPMPRCSEIANLHLNSTDCPFLDPNAKFVV